MAGVYNKSSCRTEVSLLVVSERGRGARVKQAYSEMADQVEVLSAKRDEANARLVALSRKASLDEAAVRAQVQVIEADTRAAFERYVALQMELRGLLSEKEFNQLRSFH